MINYCIYFTYRFKLYFYMKFFHVLITQNYIIFVEQFLFIIIMIANLFNTIQYNKCIVFCPVKDVIMLVLIIY